MSQYPQQQYGGDPHYQQQQQYGQPQYGSPPPQGYNQYPPPQQMQYQQPPPQVIHVHEEKKDRGCLMGCLATMCCCWLCGDMCCCGCDDCC